MRRWLGLIAACVLSLGVARVAAAYQDEGHLFTTAGVVYLSAPKPQSTTMPAVYAPGAPLAADLAKNPDALRIIVLCSQLPDQTLEYDAVQVVRHSFGLGTPAGGNWLRWVQQDLHALTGGSRQSIRNAGAEIVRQAHHAALSGKGDFADFCAVGFGIHFLGDAYAHYPFDDAGHMYASPLGHARDGHQPDLPAYHSSVAVGNWADYVAALSGALELPPCTATSSCPTAVADLETQFAAAVTSHQLATDTWGEFQDWRHDRTEDWGQQAERTAINGVLAKWASPNPQPPTKVPDATGGPLSSNQPCDAYLKSAIAEPNGFALAAAPSAGTCAIVWQRYAAIAGPVLSRAPADAFANAADQANVQPDAAGYPP
ncbi:MAG: hypothetical protein JST54_11320 [Deltaproteobacteria bacterium]|nr:hypothetical protein [Deltaproteobacteria bacterium]